MPTIWFLKLPKNNCGIQLHNGQDKAMNDNVPN